jgi:hypothetical protein
MSGEQRAPWEFPAAFWQAVEAAWQAVREVYDGLGGAEGIAAIVAAKDAWEADHPGIRWGQQCHCICGPAHPDRRDACTGDADTLIRRVYAGEPYDLPVCSGCSTAILAHA